MNKQAVNISDEQRQALLDVLPNLRRFALSLSGSLADADDLLQSTVERLLQRGLPAEAPVLPYSLKICRNLWIDDLRARRVRRSDVDSEDLVDEQAAAGEGQPITELALREAQKVLATLPEEQSAVLELVSVEGFSYKEAAGILEIPIGTVMSRLARARAALVEHFKE